jgi:hypothetical protein
MHHWLQLAAVVPAAIALAVWLYELAFVSRKTLSASRIRYPARSDHRRRKLEDGKMQDLIAVVELSTGVTLVGAAVLSAWPNIRRLSHSSR